MFFSVIIPVFNRATLINKCLTSVLSQSFTDVEIIVVDDGSSDGTLDILAAFSKKIKVFHQTNQGPGAARNLGVSQAQGQYIVFLDSDDIWFPWTLSTLYKVIQDTKLPSFIVGKTVFFSSETELKPIKKVHSEIQYFSDYYKSSSLSLQPYVGAVAIKRNVFQKVGGFSNQLFNAEDNDLWLKLGTSEGFVFINSPTILAYRQHSNSAISNLEKTFLGTKHLILQEQQKNYPGANLRQRERLRILTRHIRPVSLACIKQEKFSQGWSLYQATLTWHIQLMRIQYLIFFPLLALYKQIFRMIYTGAKL